MLLVFSVTLVLWAYVITLGLNLSPPFHLLLCLVHSFMPSIVNLSVSSVWRSSLSPGLAHAALYPCPPQQLCLRVSLLVYPALCSKLHGWSPWVDIACCEVPIPSIVCAYTMCSVHIYQVKKKRLMRWSTLVLPNDNIPSVPTAGKLP